MCLIAWSWQPGTDQPLLLIANRDEYYSRPTLAMHWWDGGEVLAGKDLAAGGTWLGVSRSGRMAALTNYRDPNNFRADAPTRGTLVANFLTGQASAMDYLQNICRVGADYNPFNLLVFDGTQLVGLESRHSRVIAIEPGIGGVSNADFSSPWPKLDKMRSELKQVVDLPAEHRHPYLWASLSDPKQAPDEQLPNTGLSLERERKLSAAFIANPDYGTRASTVLQMQSRGFSIEERRYDNRGLSGASQFSL